MFGPQILAAYLATPKLPDRFGNVWQYNSRSDKHSQVGCWGVAFDLLAHSALLRRHAEDGKVVIGINCSLRDFRTSREKKLDLVIGRPDKSQPTRRASFRTLADSTPIPLDAEQRALLESLPDIPVGPVVVSAVLVALEAKATMTKHTGALPRLYDELNSSHLCVHGSSTNALAIGYVQVNGAEEFATSTSNNRPLSDFRLQVTRHNQPHDTLAVLDKIEELPRRDGTTGTGFDAIGVTVLDFTNLGRPGRVVDEPPAPQPGDQFHYDGMIVRMANEYDSRFHAI